jgi:hypothetical protein
MYLTASMLILAFAIGVAVFAASGTSSSGRDPSGNPQGREAEFTLFPCGC